LAVHLGRDRVGVEAGAGEQLARVLDTVDPGGLDVDRLEAGLRELLPVLVLAERAGDAADPQLDALLIAASPLPPAAPAGTDRRRGGARRLACRVEVRRDRVAPAPGRRAPAAAAVAARDPLSRLPVFLLHDLLEGLVRHAVPPPPTESRSIIY